jgi:hypothetical protein
MAFDDRKTEPLTVIGCLSVVCALGVPLINRATGGWWGLLLLLAPAVGWLLSELLWRRARRRGRSCQTDPAPDPVRAAGS